MKFKIMTKDEQWTMAENMSENETIDFWNRNYSDTVAILDHVILGDDGNEYKINDDGRLQRYAGVFI